MREAVRGGARARAQGGAGPLNLASWMQITRANETFSLVWTSGLWFKHHPRCIVLESRRGGGVITDLVE